MIGVTTDNPSVNLTSYATVHPDGKLWITLINKELDLDSDLLLEVPQGYGKAVGYRLCAPAVDSKTDVTLAGAEVGPEGTWTPGALETLEIKEHSIKVAMPKSSALLISLEKE